MKKYLKQISIAALPLFFLGIATIATSSLRADTAKDVKEQAKVTQKRVLPVLVFSGVQLVWNLFSDKE